MKTLAEQMAVYAAYHRDPWNRLTHFFGVPVIVFSLLVPLSWPQVAIGELKISLAMLVVAILLLYYLLLDWRIGLIMIPLLGVLLYGADRVGNHYPARTGWTVFAIMFIGGWILQLIGHIFEGRRPALVDNFWQIFTAPIFLVAEVFFMLGARVDLQRDIESMVNSRDADRV